MDADDAARWIDAMAPIVVLPIAAAHRPGVIANLQRLAEVAEVLAAFPLDETIEPAPRFVAGAAEGPER